MRFSFLFQLVIFADEHYLESHVTEGRLANWLNQTHLKGHAEPITKFRKLEHPVREQPGAAEKGGGLHHRISRSFSG